jgi:uncharacterized membrane protein
MLFFAVQASSEGLFYIFGPLEHFDSIFREKYSSHLVLVRTHAVASVLALSTGLFALSSRFLNWRLHRWLGRLYACGVIVGGITSVPMSLMAEGGWTTRLSFLLQGTTWMTSLALAVRAARAHHFALHRRWMVRNYAVTYSAVASRLLLNGLQEGGMAFQAIYPVVSWTWMLGLAAGEWWLWYSGAQLSETGQKECAGTHHTNVGPGYPQYDGIKGLIER